jgi:hypothetical protein
MFTNNSRYNCPATWPSTFNVVNLRTKSGIVDFHGRFLPHSFSKRSLMPEMYTNLTNRGLSLLFSCPVLALLDTSWVRVGHPWYLCGTEEDCGRQSDPKVLLGPARVKNCGYRIQKIQDAAKRSAVQNGKIFSRKALFVTWKYRRQHCQLQLNSNFNSRFALDLGPPSHLDFNTLHWFIVHT